jgi:hypothetical protein
VPMLTSTSENWTIKRSDKIKIVSAEIRFLHSVARYNLLDQKRSTDMNSEIKTFNLTEIIHSSLALQPFVGRLPILSVS